MPCGNTIMPAPKLLTSLPDASKCSTVSSVDISPLAASQQVLALHRSATQIVFPSLSISTALVDPQERPSGNFANPSIVEYGFGASLVGVAPGAGVCASTPLPNHTTARPAATTSKRRPRAIGIPPLLRHR